MKSFERLVWITLLGFTLAALGLSMLSSHNQQQVFNREQYFHLVATAHLVKQMESAEWSHALESGRLDLRTYASSYLSRYREGDVPVQGAEHAKVMDMLQRDFPELLAATDRAVPDTPTK
jgi:hypothetical protein